MWDSVFTRLLKSLGLDPRQFAHLLAEELDIPGIPFCLQQVGWYLPPKGNSSAGGFLASFPVAKFNSP
jgi:hypothetical protein